MSLRENTQLSSISRGTKWLTTLQQKDGSLRGADNLGYYYKVPFAFTAAGFNLEAERLLDYIAKVFLRDDGDLDGRKVPWFSTHRIYPHGWLIISCLMRGRFEMARLLLKFLLPQHDVKTGGFFTTASAQQQRQGVQELMSNCLAGLACIWAGQLDVARQTGLWIRNLYTSQPDLSRGLYCIWDSRNGLVTDYPNDEAKAYLVDASSPNQWYFQYGISAAFLSSLAAVTGETGWLWLAKEFLQATRFCREDVYQQGTSGKIGWGAAWTYRLSRDPDDLKIAEVVAQTLYRLQTPEGYWLSGGTYTDNPTEKAKQNIDVTAEFVGLLSCIVMVLNSVNMQRATNNVLP